MVNDMANDEQILKEADYYLNNNVTIAQASVDLGVSKRTLQLHLQKLESIDQDKFKLVTDKKKSNERQGKIKGGTIGKRGSTWTDEKAKDAATYLITNDATIIEGAKAFGVPPSTFYEMINNADLDNETASLLYRLSEAHKRGMSIDQYDKFVSRKLIASDIAAKLTDERKFAGRKKS